MGIRCDDPITPLIVREDYGAWSEGVRKCLAESGLIQWIYDGASGSCHGDGSENTGDKRAEDASRVMDLFEQTINRDAWEVVKDLCCPRAAWTTLREMYDDPVADQHDSRKPTRNPLIDSVALAAAAAGGVIAAPFALPVIGFSATGPVAGTFAATWMASFGGAVPAMTSGAALFPVVQSIAMGGVAVTPIGLGVGAAFGVAYLAGCYLKK